MMIDLGKFCSDKVPKILGMTSIGLAASRPRERLNIDLPFSLVCHPSLIGNVARDSNKVEAILDLRMRIHERTKADWNHFPTDPALQQSMKELSRAE